MKNVQRVATSAFIYHEGKALIAQRAADESFLAHHWENVGGSLEWGEHPEEGVVREAKEETGLITTPLTPYHTHFYLKENKGVQIVEIAYICDPGDNPTVQLSDEHQEYKWITREELKVVEPMTPKMRGLIDRGFQYVSNSLLR